MAHIESVNTGVAKHTGVKSGMSGIDKHPVPDPVHIDVPGFGRSGLTGDAICDTPNHGGPDQAVYAYAREDLDVWAAALDRPLRAGLFGENLTTVGVDVTGAVIGERWQVGDELVLQVTSPRIPCVTFAEQMDEPGWIRRFTKSAVPGAYLRVLKPGQVRAGDRVVVEGRPESPATIGVSFRALTLEPDLLAELVDAPDLVPAMRERARRRSPG